MASTAPTKTPTPRSKAQKEKKEKVAQPSPTNERLKIVVRLLPPNLPEDIFWQSVQQWVAEDSVTSKAFYPGKIAKRLGKENIPSRAYIAFKNEEQLALFSREYDGHVFRDKMGNEFQAVVEFAPYQKLQTDKKKTDARMGTIEKDEDFISFMESLNAPNTTTEPISLESLIATAPPQAQPKTTPLLEAIKAEKSARLEKEILQRNAASKKGEPKKKAPQSKAQLQSKAPPQNDESPPPPAAPAESSKRKKGPKAPAVKTLNQTAKAGPAAAPPKGSHQQPQAPRPAPAPAQVDAPASSSSANPSPNTSTTDAVGTSATRRVITTSRRFKAAMTDAVRGGSAVAAAATTTTTVPPTGPTVPIILPRPPSSSQPPASVSAAKPSEGAAPAAPPPPRGGARGGRRSRGRGRGMGNRGAPPAAPAGGS